MKTKKQLGYIEGFVFSVPKANKAAYKKMAQEGSEVWTKFGAIDYKECRADDMNKKGVIFTFPKMAKTKPNEEVWFSYIFYKSKVDRNKISKQVEKYFSEKYKDMKNFSMPFDMQRMAIGGFMVEV